jgi:hypothetical protein
MRDWTCPPSLTRSCCGSWRPRRRKYPPLPDAILPFSAENMHFFSPGYTNFRGTALPWLRQLSQDFLELSCCSGTFFVKIQGKSLN